MRSPAARFNTSSWLVEYCLSASLQILLVPSSYTLLKIMHLAMILPCSFFK